MRAKFRERAEWEYNANMNSMYSAGKSDGIKEGIKEGVKEQSISIARKMLEKNLDIEVIIETTGLTKEEIEKLKDQKIKYKSNFLYKTQNVYFQHIQ